MSDDPDPDLLPITRADILAELRRELRMRERVYPRQVREGKMARATAARQITVLNAAIETLEAEPGKDRE
jgi:hypothetical protein